MGLSKLWGKDSTGARGFVFSHVKTIYYNWKDKKLLSTKLDEIDKDISSLNSRTEKAIISEVISSTANYAIYRIGIALADDGTPAAYFYRDDGGVIGGVRLTLS